MNKYVNILLVGFLLFILGIITLNFELLHFKFVDYLPETFSDTVDLYTVSIDEGRTYEINKKIYNSNIKIQKVIDNSIDNQIIIQVNHKKTSEAIINIDSDKEKIKILLSNELNIDSNDFYNISKLFLNCLKDKKIYNYNLLKYSEVYIFGNEEVLSNIKIG